MNAFHLMEAGAKFGGKFLSDTGKAAGKAAEDTGKMIGGALEAGGKVAGMPLEAAAAASKASHKVASKRASEAIDILEKSTPDSVKEAVNAIANVGLNPGNVLNEIGKRTNAAFEIANGLGGIAHETAKDISDLLKVDPRRKDLIDNILSIGVINSDDLDDALDREGDDEDEDDLESRRVVWQNVEPGQPLEPPYLLVVAVEEPRKKQAPKTKKAIKDKLTIMNPGLKLPNLLKGHLGHLPFGR